MILHDIIFYMHLRPENHLRHDSSKRAQYFGVWIPYDIFNMEGKGVLLHGGVHLLIPYIVFLYTLVEFLSGIPRDSKRQEGDQSDDKGGALQQVYGLLKGRLPRHPCMSLEAYHRPAFSLVVLHLYEMDDGGIFLHHELGS